MNNEVTSVIIVFVGIILSCLSVSFIYIWLYIAKKENLLTKISKAERRLDKKKRLSEHLVEPLLKLSKAMGPVAEKYPIFANQTRDEQLLTRAGNPMGISLQQFYGLRIALWFCSFLFGSFVFILGLPFQNFFLLVFPILCLFSPHLWILLEAKKRQGLINEAMADFLDTMSVTLQAGISLDSAMKQVAEHMEGPLSEEIQRLNREIGLGVPRRTAYQHLLNRNNAKELEILVRSLIQGAELGVPVSTTFRIQAEDLRATKGFNIREKAAKVSPKITIITTTLIVPSIFILVMGLLFLNFLYNPQKFGINVFFN